jgi:hypothetical protein
MRLLGQFGVRNASDAFLTQLLGRVDTDRGKGGKHVP